MVRMYTETCISGIAAALALALASRRGGHGGWLANGRFERRA
jgi:hypothetical protein